MKKIKEGYEFDEGFKAVMNRMDVEELAAMYSYDLINPLLIKDGRIVGCYKEMSR